MCGRDDDPSQHDLVKETPIQHSLVGVINSKGEAVVLRPGEGLPNGRIVLGSLVDSHDDLHVLAFQGAGRAVHPFVVWDLDNDLNAFNGTYCWSITSAVDELRRRGNR